MANAINGTQSGITVNPSTVSQIRVETAADGSGTTVLTQSVASGDSITVYSVTRDIFGNFIANIGNGTWSLTGKTDSVVDGDLVSAGDGKSAVFTGHLPGTAVIQVTSGTLTPIDSGIITVVPRLNVSGFASPVTAGTPGVITVTARDGSGNAITSYTGTVHFTSTDTQSVLPSDYTFVSSDHGTHVFSVTLKTAGTQSITVTDTVTAAATGTQSGLAVNAAGAAQIRVETAANGSGTVVPAQSVASGNSITVYAITRDTYGNFVANTAGTWLLTGKTAGVVDGDLIPAGDNKSAVFTGHLAGNAVIQVTSGTMTNTPSGVLTVIPGGIAKFNVSGFTSPVTAGTPGSITVTAQDAFTNTITNYTGTVHFTSADSQAVLPSDYTFLSGDHGSHTFNVTLKTAGTQSITAADTVTTAATGTQSSIVVNAAGAAQIRVETAANGSGTIVSPQNIAAGTSLTVYAVTRDTYGNFVANTAGTWLLTGKTGSVADSDLAPAGDGKSAVFTGHLIGTAVIDVTSGTLTVSDSGIISVVPRLNVSGFTSPATAGIAGSVTVTAQDFAGTTITGYTGTVHFASTDNQAVLPSDYTFVSGDHGTHSFSVTLKTAGTQSITATDTVTTTATGTQSGITVNAAGASQIRVETAANGSGTVVPAQSLASGNSITVYAITRDTYGNFVSNAAGTCVADG